MANRALLFIVTRPGDQQVLLLQTDHGWSLPVYDDAVPDNVGFADPGPFNRWFRERYGMEVVRRYALDQQGSTSAIFVVECRLTDPETPKSGLWIGSNEVPTTSFSRPQHRSFLKAWFADSRASRTMPWSRPGGYEEAIAWMFGKLHDMGITPSGALEQVKNAYVSTVFRCKTDHGDVYLKILPGIFVRELEVTQKLMDWNITMLPQWIASDAVRGLVLMKDMGGCDLTDCCHIGPLKAVMRRFSEFQLASIPFLDVEHPDPFYDWRVSILMKKIDWAVEKASALLRDTKYQLTSEEMAHLHARLPGWKELCLKIEDAGIPDALDHGDLRPGNIRIVSGEIVFYDWAWSAITHPFMGPTGFLHIIRHLLPQDRNVRELLRDVYLEVWENYGPMERLRHVFDLVDKVKTLYGVVADAEWLHAIHSALNWKTPGPASADAWTLDRRQYYFAKMIRRLF